MVYYCRRNFFYKTLKIDGNTQSISLKRYKLKLGLVNPDSFLFSLNGRTTRALYGTFLKLKINVHWRTRRLKVPSVIINFGSGLCLDMDMDSLYLSFVYLLTPAASAISVYSWNIEQCFELLIRSKKKNNVDAMRSKVNPLLYLP